MYFRFLSNSYNINLKRIDYYFLNICNIRLLLTTMKSIVAPEVNMMLVSQSSENQRKAIRNFAPRIGLSVVNYDRLEEIDNFYIDCQRFRDYYRDPYNKLPRPVAFHKHYGKCQYHPESKCTAILTSPLEWVTETQPVICPVKYGRELKLDEGIRLGGSYNIAPCIKYKR